MSGFNFEGIYIGIVKENKDDKKLGRLKVLVPNVFGNIKTDDLPWAQPCFPYTFDNQSSFFIPEIGSLVCIMFLNGSQYSPIWIGAIHRENENKIPDEINDDSYPYPERKIIKTQSGYVMFHDEDDKEYIEIKQKNNNHIYIGKEKNKDIIEIKHKSGTYIRIEENGDMNVKIVGNYNVNVDGETNINSKGNTNITGINVNLN